MKIKAIRVAEVGPFGAGVALEHLTGGLDVLVGPNETGKSTLFRALCLLISQQHTSVAKPVQALKPNRGGAPLIEADLELDGSLWRLRKRFLTQRSAELIELSTGAIARGSDAETKAAELFHAGSRDVLRNLVWVAQAESFALPDAKGDLASAVAQLIEAEAAAAAGAGDARRVLAAAQAKLAELVTSRGPKIGGPLAKAIAHRQDLAGALADARQSADQAAARLQQLEQLRAEQASAADPAVGEELRRAVEAARAALADASTNAERKRTADEKVSARDFKRANAASALDAFDARCKRISELQAEQEQARVAAARLAAERAAAIDRSAAAQGTRDDAASRIAALRKQLAQRNEADRKAAARREADALGQRLSSARTAAARVAELAADLAARPVRADLVAEAHKSASSFAALEARVSAGSPHVSINLDPRGAGRLSIAGEPIAADRRVVVERPLEIIIEGIGTIVVEPSYAAVGDALAERDRARTKLADLLARMAVADIVAADAALDSRRVAERAHDDAAAELRTLAPNGLAALEADHAALLAGTSGDAAPPDLPARAELDAEIAAADPQLGEAETAAARIAKDAQSLAESAARCEARLSALDHELAALAGDLPQPSARDAFRTTLVAALAAATAEADEAIRERTAWAGAALDDARLAALKQRQTQADASLVQFEHRRHRLEREIAEIEGALRRDGEEGAGAEVEALEESYAAASARVADLELDVRALAILCDRLSRIGEDHRQQVLRPLIERLRPSLNALHIDAALDLDAPLTPAALARTRDGAAVTDTHGQLSDGTREQIAVLVRLAYARLMAERGIAMPLVLDDALAFSDDARFEAMLGQLADSARLHQVVVLSCRERSFDRLFASGAARRLEIVPWNGEESRSAPTKKAGRTKGSGQLVFE